jgi:hypothetical protein
VVVAEAARRPARLRRQCGAQTGAVHAERGFAAEFRAEGAVAFDVDRDGHPDIVTDEFWYAGPDFTPHEIRAPEVCDPLGYRHSVSAWGDDLDGDGWTDLVVAPFPTDACSENATAWTLRRTVASSSRWSAMTRSGRARRSVGSW